MRIYYPNLSRPKKAAKRLRDHFPNIHLATAQEAIAQTVGYRDWHELEKCHKNNEPSPLDQVLPEADFRFRMISCCVSLSRLLGIADGDIQFIIADLRLSGDRSFTEDDQHAIRIACWRNGPMPYRPKRQRGATFLMKEKGYAPCQAYWRSMDAHTEVVYFICDTAFECLCASFEAITPRTPVRDFVPLRLWLPYGWWTLTDGSEILFSRDYKPLWKIYPSGTVERTPSSLWVTGIQDQRWFTKETGTPWYRGEAKMAAENRLRVRGISKLPKLVDAMPLLMENDEENIRTAAKKLDESASSGAT